MKRLYAFFLLLFLFVAQENIRAQISLGSVNDFEDGTTMGWGPGGFSPVNIPTDGPGGLDDNYLALAADGIGSFSRLIIYNSSSAWTGNWTAAGVSYISFMARNPGTVDLTLRISLDGAGGRISSANGIPLAAGTGWTRINIPVLAANFTLVGGTDIASTLANVTIMRILHNTFPAWQGEVIVSNFDIDVVSAQNIALPVTLDYFTATADKFKTTIAWKTLTESNSSTFEVERSADGTNWELLEKVAAAGNSNLPLYYKTTDLYPHKGVSYYRLKQVDIDNRFKYSPVRSVTHNGAIHNSITIYPNPALSVITVAGKNPVDISSVIVTSVTGQIVNNKIAISSLSAFKARIDISSLPSGIYYIKTKNGSAGFFINGE